jgi:hypothetical protein
MSCYGNMSTEKTIDYYKQLTKSTLERLDEVTFVPITEADVAVPQQAPPNPELPATETAPQPPVLVNTEQSTAGPLVEPGVQPPVAEQVEEPPTDEQHPGIGQTAEEPPVIDTPPQVALFADATAVEPSVDQQLVEQSLVEGQGPEPLLMGGNDVLVIPDDQSEFQ